ncbi:MAG: preprotein translocase subunit YajC [Lachnospiraceae bacterium]|nr:preprotein translocase subunit YajC [Lachnospiraceae bacterium]
MNGFLTLLTQTGATGDTGSFLPLVIMIVVFVAVFYFFIMRPQANQEKKQKALLASLEIGDSVLTTAGFYGVIIDMVEGQDIIIVEFGNNKNCRIPMRKSSVIEVEKANAE